MEKSVLIAKHQGHSDCALGQDGDPEKISEWQGCAQSQALAPGSASPLGASVKTSKASTSKWLMRYVIIWTRHGLGVKYTGVKLPLSAHVLACYLGRAIDEPCFHNL